MKKKIILGIMLVASMSTFAEMEIENGYRDVEISTAYTSFKKIEHPYAEFHTFVNNQNDFIIKQNNNLSWDKENTFRIYIDGGSSSDVTTTGGGLLYYHGLYIDGTFAGFQSDVKKIKFSKKEKNHGTRGMFRPFYEKQKEDGSRFFISPYYILDNLKGIKNNAIGIYAKQEYLLDFINYEIEGDLKLLVDFNAYRNKVKKINEKTENKNDSMQANLGFSYEKEFGDDDFKIIPKITATYEKEFLGNRKYRVINLEEKDTELAKVGLEIKMSYNNIEFSIEDMYMKSTNSRNSENRIQTMLTYKF